MLLRKGGVEGSVFLCVHVAFCPTQREAGAMPYEEPYVGRRCHARTVSQREPGAPHHSFRLATGRATPAYASVSSSGSAASSGAMPSWADAKEWGRGSLHTYVIATCSNELWL